MRRIFITGLLTLSLVGGIAVSANAESTSGFAALQAQIAALQAQLQVLLGRISGTPNMTVSTAPSTAPTIDASGSVTLGEVAGSPTVSCMVPAVRQLSTGGSVSLLQLLLTQEGSYPEGFVTGYYGRLTAAAVSRFQASHGLAVSGTVDAATAKLLTELSAKYYPKSCGSPEPSPMCEYAQPPAGCRWEGSMTYPQCEARLVCDQNNTPVISGISGPQSLQVSQPGTWTVRVSNQSGGNLSYSVDWGDGRNYEAGNMGMEYLMSTNDQTATFTHSFSRAGMYTSTFTVTNQSGQSAQTSLSVNVGGTVSAITVTSPQAGETWQVGEKYEIRWTTNDPSMRPLAGRVSITLNSPRPACLDAVTGPRCMIAERSPYVIAEDVVDSGSFTWAVPPTLPEGYRGASQITITRIGEPALRGRSGTFTVAGNVGSRVQIFALRPTAGSVGTTVMVTGSGFTPTGNRIKFGSLGSEQNPRYSMNSSDGRTLIFTVPYGTYYACWDTEPACMVPAQSIAPGVYAVSVLNANGTSNEISFTVTDPNSSNARTQ